MFQRKTENIGVSLLLFYSRLNFYKLLNELFRNEIQQRSVLLG